MPGSARSTSPALCAVTRLIEGAKASARTTSVFGDPIVSGGATIVPVARVTALTLMGGGTGRLLLRTSGDGAGGTGFVRARPAGFLVLDGDGARFRPIRQPATALVLPLALITAVTATRIVGVSLREARRRRRQAAVEEAHKARRSG